MRKKVSLTLGESKASAEIPVLSPACSFYADSSMEKSDHTDVPPTFHKEIWISADRHFPCFDDSRLYSILTITSKAIRE